MRFETLGEKERILLLTALDFDINKLKCQNCGEPTNHKKCCIMPSVETKKSATILCDSVLCMAWYLEELDSKEKK